MRGGKRVISSSRPALAKPQLVLLPRLTLLTYDAFASRACRSHHQSQLAPWFHAGCFGSSAPTCRIGNKPAPAALAANIAHGPVNQTCPPPLRILACLLFMNSELSQRSVLKGRAARPPPIKGIDDALVNGYILFAAVCFLGRKLLSASLCFIRVVRYREERFLV